MLKLQNYKEFDEARIRFNKGEITLDELVEKYCIMKKQVFTK